MNLDREFRAGLIRRVACGAMALTLVCGQAVAQNSQPAQPVEEQPQTAEERDARRERRNRQGQSREEQRAAMPEARRLLLDCAARLNSARTFRASVIYRTEGNLPVALGGAEARLIMVKPEDQKYHSIMRLTGTGSLKKDDPAAPFDVAWYIDQIQYLDEAVDKVVVRRGRATDPEVRLAEQIRLKELLGPNPWNAELERADTTVSGEEEIGGVRCKVIDISYQQNRRTARLWLGADDLLPRRFARYTGLQNEAAQFSASFIWDFTDVEIDAPLTVEDAKVPSGGKEREEFVIVERPSAEERREVGVTPQATPPRAGEEPAPKPQERPSREVRQAATDFTLKSADGSQVSLSSLRGNVVVLDFWGTWCIPCKKSSPEAQALHERFKDRGLRVLGLAVRERSEEKPISYFKEKGYTYTLLLGADNVAKQYNVTTYPTFIVIGPEGQILHRAERYEPETTFKTIAEIVEKNLPAGG